MVAITGNITESLAITDWRVTATKCKDGSLSGTTIVAGGATYSVTCLDTDPVNLTLAPKIDYAWQPNKSVTVGDFIVAANPDGTPHIWKATTAPVGDANISSRRLLLLFAGADNSTTFTDLSPSAHTITPHGNAKITNNALVLDGASGTYLSTESSSNFDWSTGDLTLECFITITALPASGASIILGTNNAFSDSKTGVYINSDGSIAIGKIGVSEARSSAGVVSSGTKYHLAIIRSGSTTVVTLNGVVKINNNGQWSSGASVFNIGYTHPSNGTFIKAVIEGFRLSNYAVYSTSGFTPPTANPPGPYLNTGTTEPVWNLAGTTNDANGIVWTYVAPLVDPVTIGPKIPA